MKDKINSILSEVKTKISEAANENELQNVKNAYVGKQGALSMLMKEMPKLDAALRPEMGKVLNQAKNQVTELINSKRTELKLKASEVSPDFDCSVPGILPPNGGLHPITQMCYDLNDAFRSMGFEIFQEDDITSELYAFDKLNFPPNHPARESMDTYWLEGHDSGSTNEKLCLRPHLTGGSVRYMQTHKPPYRFVYPGRVYRNEAISYRAHCFFHQVEALYVDKNVSFADLKQALLFFAKEMFSADTKIRLRPSYFPFTEPSAEMDISCNICGGKGCPFCKGTGWVEILGCGMVDPNVLENCGIDSKVYSGYALGMGIERITNLKYQVKDLRMFSENDVRFLRQFESAN